MAIQAPKGFEDLLPGAEPRWKDSNQWHHLEELFRQVAHQYGYQEYRPPLVEFSDLYVHGVGTATDIVSKEMFNIVPRGDDPEPRRMTMRPEFTAGLARLFIENGLTNQPQPVKLFTYGPLFRYENVQKGRFRQHVQLDVEVFGAADPAVDAEVIHLGLDLVGRMGLQGLVVHVNSIGCPACRPRYRDSLRSHFQPYLGELCPDCNTRFEKNPLRLLDCKKDAIHPAGQSAPVGLDYLCDDCKAHWEGLLLHLQVLGAAHKIDPRIVRGLDYYTKTVFEILHPKLGAQSTLWGGGRYDGLMESVGGRPTPGVGFGMGVERVLMVMAEEGLLVPGRPRMDLFVATVGEDARRIGLKLLYDLRRSGFSADIDYLSRSLKAQMKYAGKLGARYVAIIGADEVRQGTVALKVMESGEQRTLPLTELLDSLDTLR